MTELKKILGVNMEAYERSNCKKADCVKTENVIGAFLRRVKMTHKSVKVA